MRTSEICVFMLALSTISHDRNEVSDSYGFFVFSLPQLAAAAAAVFCNHEWQEGESDAHFMCAFKLKILINSTWRAILELDPSA